VDLLTELTILILAAFVGFEVISKVLVIGEAEGVLNEVILVIAIAFGTINVVGGFLVTDRMLEMFKKKPTPPKDDD
jgi:NAD(P) transhydrogenase subunit alpha